MKNYNQNDTKQDLTTILRPHALLLDYHRDTNQTQLLQEPYNQRRAVYATIIVPHPTQQDPQLHEEAVEGIQSEEVTNATETTASITETTATTTWTATATSNPFEHSFKVNLNGAEAIESAAMFTATLTDMSGKVYTAQTLSKEALTEEQFGQDLAPGMYLMTLRQGEELRLLRVVKR